MSNKSKKKILEDCDHAFELTLILITIMLGILSQYVPTELEINLPPIIANMRRLSIIFIFPLSLTILAWITIYLIDNDYRKMHFRIYAWGSIIFSGFFGVIEFFVICHPISSHPTWIDNVYSLFLLILTLLGLLIPTIPILLIKRILERYKMALGNTKFFESNRKIPIPFLFRVPITIETLIRYTPFALSYIVFWLAVFLTMLA